MGLECAIGLRPDRSGGGMKEPAGSWTDTSVPAAEAGWTPLFPADRLWHAGDSRAAARACDGRDRHRLTISRRTMAGFCLSGVALIVVDVHLGVHGRGVAVGIGFVLASALSLMFDRWVDGPVLCYRTWGRLRRLQLTSVTSVDVKTSRFGGGSLLLSAPGRSRPMRLVVWGSSFAISPAARAHLRGWLSTPHVHWTPEAAALLDVYGGGATRPASRRRRLVGVFATVVLSLAIVGAGVWLAHRRAEAARTIAGAPGYHTFGGPRGKPLPLGRPWGRPCQPIRFAVDRHVPDAAYAQIAAVVREARRGGLDVTLESRSFAWSPSSLYYLDGQSPADVVEVGIFPGEGTPPRHSKRRPEHIRLGWDAQLDPDGRHETLTLAQGDLWLKSVSGDPLALRRAIRQLVALTQGIIGTSWSDSGLASDSTVDRFTAADIAAMKRMSGCAA